MSTGLTFLFVAVGVLLSLTKFFIVGFLCLGMATVAWKFRTELDEDYFSAFLAFLAFLGIVFLFIEQLIGRLILS